MNFPGYTKNHIMGRFDKREIHRSKLASIVPMDSSKWDMELSRPVNGPELEKLLAKFEDETIEDNIFFGKTFLTAAFGRMNAPETCLLTVWETIDSTRHLRMYFPVVPERIGIPGNKAWRCWSHDYAPLGVPIVSQHDAGEVLDRFLQLLSLVDNKSFPALVFDDVPIEGVFAARMCEALKSTQKPYCQISNKERAILRHERNSASQSILNISSKKRRQLHRQLRRLEESGKLQLECVSGYTDVILRFEEFLLLEAKGWKGRKGTSMHTIKQTAAFARQSVTELAREGHCSIYSIRIDGKSIASLIVLASNGVYYPWKIAFDQDYSQFSPGALLMYRVSEDIAAATGFVRADSLAGSANQLVNLLWKQRMKLGSIIIATGTGSQKTVEKLAACMEREFAWREGAKKILNR